MNTRTVERVERWESRPFSGGYEGLNDLAGSDFTGAVETSGTWLFMLNGRAIGVHDGSIDAFEDASGTAHVAPEPALPLLFTMWEGDTETRAKYYTEDTPISEVDETLSSGSFTGYLELSENVLSGDYFVVYYGGRSMSAAFVGSRDELLGDEEAFERANDEVGIYEVCDATVEVTDIPSPEPDPEPSPTGSAASESSPSDAGTEEPTAAGSGESDPTATEPVESDPTPAEPADDSPSARESASKRSDPSTVESVEATGDGPSEDRSSLAATIRQDVDTGPDDDLPPEPTRQAESASSVSESPAPAVDSEPPTEDSPVRESEPDRASNGSESGRANHSTSDAGRTPTREPARETDQSDQHEEVEERESSVSGVESIDTEPREQSSSRAGSEPTSTGESSTAQESTAGGSNAAPASGTTLDEEPATTPEQVTSSPDPGEESVTGEAGSDPIEAEADWREATIIPSLDPTHSAHPEPEPTDAGSRTNGGPRTPTDASPPEQESRPQSTASTERRRDSTPDRSAGTTTERSTGTSTDRTADEQPARNGGSAGSPGHSEQRTSPDTVPKAKLEAREERIEKLETEIERLQSAHQEVNTERDELAAENKSMAEEIERLETEVERLRSELAEVESALEAAGKTAYDADQQIQPSQAISGTNLFVRYGSKGKDTLETAHDGTATADDVDANLKLERHTTFEADAVAVQGEPYDTFLDDTLELQFVDWVVRTLLYEIQNTGHESGLSDLYDAIPQIDRVEFDGEIELTYREDGENVTEVATFDVVLRNRMGEPLIVADLSDSRDPANERMLVELESDATRVKEASETLSAAFLVTASFFEPGALEAASEATSGSFLSRDSRMSFVKQSRKQGYHLCLVEARGDEFHLNVPEL
ncbi:transcriptional regulator [Natronoarchaeum sp. GCM10025321]|uniref:DUF7527 domain-containing protein n=2 Tax=unclassified Natronoarchaeum TaxID=2620183 RepID=UPI00360A1DCE